MWATWLWIKLNSKCQLETQLDNQFNFKNTEERKYKRQEEHALYNSYSDQR